MRTLLLLAAALLAAPVAAQCPADTTRDPEAFYVVEQMPQLIGGLASLRPEWTQALRRDAGEVEGRVFVRFLVDEDGSVSDIEVVRGLTPALDAEAVATVRRARFEPGMRCGRPVAMPLALPISFRLD